jgi:hypothetical protein
MRGHARFEGLEGAILLGEASAEERAEFAEHARHCALCNGAASAATMTYVGAARDTETWRPSVERPILARIRDERMRRSRFAVGVLGWAAACSIAVNVAFVTGLAGKLGGALEFEAAPSSVAAEPFTRLPAQTFLAIKRRSLPAGSALALHRTRPRHPVAALAAGPRVPARLVPPVVETADPDIFAGLDARGSNQPRNVAVETQFCEGPCAAPASEPRP